MLFCNIPIPLVYFNNVSNVDTHMTKNVEWGAVAYLAHSKYGLNGEEICINTNSSYKTGYGIGDTTSTSGTGLQIATGTIEATNAEVKDSYTITMWVNDSVTISDTDTATYCASTCAGNAGKATYSDLFYSFKIRVDAEG